MFGQNKDIIFGQNKVLMFGPKKDLIFGQRAVSFSPVSSNHCRLKLNLGSLLFIVYDDWDDGYDGDQKDTMIRNGNDENGEDCIDRDGNDDHVL